MHSPKLCPHGKVAVGFLTNFQFSALKNTNFKLNPFVLLNVLM